MGDIRFELFNPYAATVPKRACLGCEVSWVIDEGDACWSCGGPGITYNDLMAMREREREARLAAIAEAYGNTTTTTTQEGAR